MWKVENVEIGRKNKSGNLPIWDDAMPLNCQERKKMGWTALPRSTITETNWCIKGKELQSFLNWVTEAFFVTELSCLNFCKYLLKIFLTNKAWKIITYFKWQSTYYDSYLEYYLVDWVPMHNFFCVWFGRLELGLAHFCGCLSVSWVLCTCCVQENCLSSRVVALQHQGAQETQEQVLHLWKHHLIMSHQNTESRLRVSYNEFIDKANLLKQTAFLYLILSLLIQYINYSFLFIQ